MKKCWNPTYWLPLSLLVAGVAVVSSAIIAVTLWMNGGVENPDRTLFLAILIPAGAFLGFRYQRILDRRTEAYKSRKELYFEYCDARALFLVDPTGEHAAALFSAADKLRIMCGGETWKNLERHQYILKRVMLMAGRIQITDQLLTLRYERLVFSKLVDCMRIDLENQMNFFKGHGSVRLGEYRMLQWKSYKEAHQDSLPRRLRKSNSAKL